MQDINYSACLANLKYDSREMLLGPLLNLKLKLTCSQVGKTLVQCVRLIKVLSESGNNVLTM